MWDEDSVSLDLSGDSLSSAGNRLGVGQHLVVVTKSEIVTRKNGGKEIKVTLKCVKTGGVTWDHILVSSPDSRDEKVQKALMYGRQRLKTLLTYGGAKNPNHFSGLTDLFGLVVKVNVTQDRDWTDRDGRVRQGYIQPDKFAPYSKPTDEELAETKSSSPKDDLPF